MPFPLLPFLAGLAPSLIGAGAGLFGQHKQQAANMQLAQFQADANERYLQKYLDYNTPAMQMQRFKEAGLNPHLVYGQGSPGNQQAPLTYPDIKPADYQQLASQLGPLINQSMLTRSQVQATDAKTRQTYAMTELNKLQARVLEKNPLLDDAGFKATIDALKSSAEIKAAESDVRSQTRDFLLATHTDNVQGLSHGWQKLEQEFANLQQRFRLGEADAKLKAEVLTSKEFLNALSEIQVRWMKDGDITPQHILQFIQLLLMKAL